MREIERLKQLEEQLMSGDFERISLDELRELLGAAGAAGLPEPAADDDAARQGRAT